MKKWTLSPQNEELIRYLSQELNVCDVVSHLLINRGINDINQAKQFLYPSFSTLSSPFEMKDMEKAVNKISQKINENAKIFIYGDYDVDGITATSILYKVISSVYKNVNYYIPNRLEEGYGLNCEALNKIKQDGASLVITVDCGIQSIEEVDYAKSIGLEIIITDHHIPSKKVPNASAIVNPHQIDCKYPFKELSGAGVAYQLARALIQTFKKKCDVDEQELLALVTLGTIADLVPLLGENRILVKYGMEALKNTKNPGLLSLFAVSGLKNNEATTEQVGFWIAPRLNASGRIKNAYLALELLLTNNAEKAHQIAGELNKINLERQKILETTLEEAICLIEKHINLAEEQVILLAWENWHPGIIGLVASKIAEKYLRPALIIAIEGNTGKGSGRSIKNIDLFKAITDCNELLIKAGGHHQAVGFQIQRENIKAFRKKVNTIIKETFSWKDMESSLDIELLLKPDQINMKIISEVDKLLPFGLGNPKPIFALKDVSVVSTPKILKNKHVKFQIGNNENTFNVIGFNQAKNASLISYGKTLDIAFNLDINEWQGNKSINLKLKEMGNDKI